MKEEVVVLYPAPEIGHLVSMVELAKHLLHHQHTNTTTTSKFSIIILLTTGGPLDTSATASYVHRISLTNPYITFRHFPALTSSTSAVASSPSTIPRSHAAVLFEFIRLNTTNVLHALQDISITYNVRSLVIDLFCTSALPIARDLRIPVYYFFTSGAAILGCFLYFPTIDKQINNKSFKDLTSTYLQFPGLPPIPAPHVPEPLLDRDDLAYADFIYFCKNLPNSDGIIVNTFDDLEPISVKTVAKGVCVPNSITPPVYYIGPLIAASRSVESMKQELDCVAEARDSMLSWLDTQPRQSVVYLCFGSRGSFSPAQIKEMANGLESSGQRFLWVIKSKSGTQDVHLLLPDGFLERTKGRGVVAMTWVPQVEVLRHEFVGGFVTHCGWNSVLEAVVAGVPMVAWPLYAEQHVNKAVLTENMKMAIPLKEREGDRFVTATELAKRVRELMESEVGRELRKRSWKMREMAMAAWGESGSSTTALVKLVGLWKQ